MAKRNMNYFGCLKGEKLNELSAEQRLKHFKTKKLFVTTRVLNLPSNTPINLLDANNFKVRLDVSIINNKTSPNFDFVHMLENANGIPKIREYPKARAVLC